MGSWGARGRPPWSFGAKGLGGATPEPGRALHLRLGASGLQDGEGVSDLCHFHGTQVPEDFAVPVRRTAPAGRRQASMSHGFLPGAFPGEGRKDLPPAPQGSMAGDRSARERRPVPEVHAADVGEAGAAQATGLHEVLGGEYQRPHPRLGHGLLRIHGLGDKQAASTGQVRAPHPVGKGHAHSGCKGWFLPPPQPPKHSR